MKSKILLAFSFFLISVNCLKAQVTYESQNVSLLGNWTDSTIIPEPAHGIKFNGIWGWVDDNGREYGIIGSNAGTYFIDVTDPFNPVELDYVPGAHGNCIWREIKTHSHYAYITSDDALPNTFQIVDLQYLPDSVHVIMNSDSIFARVHTLWIDNGLMYCASVKGGPSPSYMAVYSLANPELPQRIAAIENDFALPGPAHDMYVRNDSVFVSDGFNGLFIFTFNRSTNHFQFITSLTSYPSQGYNHSSALTADGKTLVFTDEVPDGLPVKVLDITDLQNVVVRSTFSSNSGGTPHNPFMVGNTCYISYYQDGLQIFDVSSQLSPVRIGYFDTHHQSPIGGPFTPDPYAGAWGAYPFLPSGNILVSDMQNGLFTLTLQLPAGINDQSAATNVQVYPNPAKQNDNIRVKTDFQTESAVSVLDLQGRMLMSGVTSNSVFNISSKALSAGNYLVRIENESTVQIRKLIIN